MLKNQSLDAKNAVFLPQKRGVSMHYIDATVALWWRYVELTDSQTPNRHFSAFAAERKIFEKRLRRAILFNHNDVDSRIIVLNVSVDSSNIKVGLLSDGLYN